MAAHMIDQDIGLILAAASVSNSGLAKGLS